MRIERGAGPERPDHGGIVDQHLDWPPAVLDRGQRAADLVWVGDVGRYGERSPAALGDLLDCLLHLIGRAGQYGDACAGGGQPEGHGPADAPATSGDQGDPAGECLILYRPQPLLSVETGPGLTSAAAKQRCGVLDGGCCRRRVADPPAAAVLGADAGRDRRGLDEETAQWLAALGGTGTGRERDEAIVSLHEFLLRVAGRVAPPRGQHPVTGPELDDLARQAADDALLAITTKLGQFPRGESVYDVGLQVRHP